MFKLSESSKKNREGINPDLVAISDLAITISKVDFGHGKFSGMRDKDTQNGLFRAGKSKADGYVKLSNHQSGQALDFYAYVDGKASWDKLDLAIVACAFLQAASILGFRLGWGGAFRSFDDYPHVELLD